MEKIVRQDAAYMFCSETDATDEHELKITPHSLPEFS